MSGGSTDIPTLLADLQRLLDVVADALDGTQDALTRACRVALSAAPGGALRAAVGGPAKRSPAPPVGAAPT